MFADKKIQVQRHQQLARGHTAGRCLARGRSSSDFVSSALRATPGKTPRWSGVPDAVGPLAGRDLPSLYSSFLHGGCDNPFRVSGASAWFLGSRRGTLGWEIRQPPKYYKQLLLITRPASSPLSAHNPTRNRGADDDGVGGNFQFQAVEAQLCQGLGIQEATPFLGLLETRQTLLTNRSLDRPPTPHPCPDGQEDGWGGKETGYERKAMSLAFVRQPSS